MMDTKHTPGPWATTGEGLKMLVRGADMTIVALRHRLPRETHEANARLIAAAPSILHALREIEATTVELTMDKAQRLDVIFEIARAAISKATGEPA